MLLRSGLPCISVGKLAFAFHAIRPPGWTWSPVFGREGETKIRNGEGRKKEATEVDRGNWPKKSGLCLTYLKCGCVAPKHRWLASRLVRKYGQNSIAVA